jgi:hypothetical protein
MIIGLFENDSIMAHMEKSRERQSDYHDQIYKANEKLLEYKKKRQYLIFH